MTSGPSGRNYGQANTFQPDEIAAMVRLFRKLDTPASRDLIRDAKILSVRAKFLRMHEKCEAPRTSENT